MDNIIHIIKKLKVDDGKSRYLNSSSESGRVKAR